MAATRPERPGSAGPSCDFSRFQRYMANWATPVPFC